MKLFGKDLETDVALIAEIGVNHEGSLDKARDLLRLAAGAGADAVKFQTYSPDRFASAQDPDRLARVTTFDLGMDGFRALAAEAENLGVAMFSTAVTEDVVPFLAETFPVIKIASGDVTFKPVIEAAAKTDRPVILSTGLATDAEVDRAVGWFREACKGDDIRNRLALTHCVSAYPTPIEQANVRAVPYLAERTGLHVGYSNHVIGADACLAAAALGACMIEVHFTDCKTGRTFRDHELSFEPADLRKLADDVTRIRASLGDYGKSRQPSEEANLQAVRKGIVAARDLKAGTRLTLDDLMFARPATEFDSNEIDAVVGCDLTEDVSRGVLIPRGGVRKG